MMNESQVARESSDRSATVATVITTIETLIQDWEVDEPIGPETRVVADLGFESIDLIQMVGALEQAFRPRRISLGDILVTDGRYVDDLSVGQIADGIAVRIGQNAEK